MKITIVGGSHGSGRALAEQALKAGHDVTVVSRSGTGVGSAKVVTGDAKDPSVAKEAVAGADAVVVTVGGSKDAPRIRTQVTETVVEAMREAGVTRLVVQSSVGAGDSAHQLPFVQRHIAPLLLKQPLADHDAQEDVVRASGLQWTIVRPTGLTNKDATGTWKTLRDDEPGTLGGTISRGDVGGCLLACLTDPTTVGTHLGISKA